MIRHERERLVDRLASGHAGPDETKDILARAEEDPQLARLIRADRAIVVGVAMDQTTLPPGAIEPGARLVTALQASSNGLSGLGGGSLLVKGVVGSLGAIGLAVGILYLSGTPGAPAPQRVSSVVRTIERIALAVPSQVSPPATFTEEATRPPAVADRSSSDSRVEPRARVRNTATHSARGAGSQRKTLAKSQGSEVDQTDSWRKAGSRRTIQKNATTAQIKAK